MSPVLVRIAPPFISQIAELGRCLGWKIRRQLAGDWLLIDDDAERLCARQHPLSALLRWHLPLQHLWPCQPLAMTSLIEKTAQVLAQKFGGWPMQTALVGSLQGGTAQSPYRPLTMRLRGRLLQVLDLPAIDAEALSPQLPCLYVLIGNEGVFAGCTTPLNANGFYPGGTKHIRQANGISRAGAKVASALHQLALFQAPPQPGSHWLELGASPGGMTSELLQRRYRVTAIDRAPLDPRLSHNPLLRAVCADAVAFRPAPGERFDALLCDMNGEPASAMRTVLAQCQALAPASPVIFTHKLPHATQLAEVQASLERGIELVGSELKQLTATHLSYNRHELTQIFCKA